MDVNEERLKDVDYYLIYSYGYSNPILLRTLTTIILLSSL